MDQPRVPTLDDLRVKLCYICREEESHDHPENPPKPWTHPCRCTLVAHEACLLEWIQTSQATPARAPQALKCPQCGTKYELISHNPILLQLLDGANKALSVVGRAVTVVTLSGVVASFGTGVYLISTAYGAYALREFIGKNMYDLFLSDDPARWPWHSFINLPLIPLSLILSRTPVTKHVLPIVPILLTWSSASPVQPHTLKLSLYPKTSSHWPPSPILVGIVIVPLARALYRRFFSQLSHWVLDSSPAPALRVRPFEWALNEGVGAFGLRIDANVVRDAPAPGANQAAAGQPPVADAGAAAERTIRISGASLGRLIGGALIIPSVSSFMGRLLLRATKHSVLLRRVLAVRPSISPSLSLNSALDKDEWARLSIANSVRKIFGLVWSGSVFWTESDPVWWRNTVGLGLFVMAKDCVYLLHLWLAKRELESRHVKSRPFNGVDPAELDLISGSTYTK